MVQNQHQLGLFALNNNVLLRTIADVCVSHGLEQRELEDRERYPDRRDIENDEVNVRFAAILLRLGDLLEMSHDRACPLLLSAACPLPSESYAHWTQYQRIVHSLTAPDRIELKAECENQEEHRFLRDWCQWLASEVKNASILMSRSTRHSNWQLPATTIGGPDSTIHIVPSPNATYIPSDWKFELDADAIFKRLIDDVYADPLSFVRELIQNALDATRCQLYLDLKKDGLEVPEYPTQVDKERRDRYPIRVDIRAEEMLNPLSGEIERRHIVSVTDQGIGMDRDIINRYLLQVGRSYYSTSEFQRNFRFIPTSRFGLGFLSVFAVSDRVVVETYKPTSPSSDGRLRLALTGPRNYLLLEKGQSGNVTGTKVEVLLREPLAQGELTRAVAQWCRKVEFPVAINDLGAETVVTAETSEQFTYKLPDVTDPGAEFAVRAFDVNRHGIEGELYVFVRTDSRGESWSAWNWSRYYYPSKHPHATEPSFPGRLVCLHGITVEQSEAGQRCERIDYRDGSIQPVLSRDLERHRHSGRGEADRRISSRWEELLQDHLASAERAKGKDGWIYKQSLIDHFDLPSFWADVAGTIPVYGDGKSRLMSLRDLVSHDKIATIISPKRQDYYQLGGQKAAFVIEGTSGAKFAPLPDVTWSDELPGIAAENIEELSSLHRQAIFKNRGVDSVKWLADGRLAVYWQLGAVTAKGRDAHLVCLPEKTVAAIAIHKTLDSVYGSILFNANNELITWFLRIEERCARGELGLSTEKSDRLLSKLLYAARYRYGDHMEGFVTYFKGWRDLKELTGDLRPPDCEITPDLFSLLSPAAEE